MNNSPPFLYRAFLQKDYAIQFVEHGRIRLRLMIKYRDMEKDSRQDISEGQSSTYTQSMLPTVILNKDSMEITSFTHSPGLLHVSGTHINPVYLLCTSGPGADLDFLRDRFGQHIVKINDPRSLLRDINTARPQNSRMEIVGRCTLERVLYTKGLTQELDPNSFGAVRLTYVQKQPHFSSECEYRYIVTTRPLVHEEPDEFLWYDFNHNLDYLETM